MLEYNFTDNERARINNILKKTCIGLIRQIQEHEEESRCTICRNWDLTERMYSRRRKKQGRYVYVKICNDCLDRTK